jgi:uncharacterized membrane protein
MILALNLAGFFLAVLGSCIAMWGVFKQANEYHSDKSKVRLFLRSIFGICREFVVHGKGRASDLITQTVNKKRAEDRVQSLIGLYAVFLGFLLQVAGSALLFLAFLAGQIG